MGIVSATGTLIMASWNDQYILPELVYPRLKFGLR